MHLIVERVDTFRRLETIHHRHLQIHDYHLELDVAACLEEVLHIALVAELPILCNCSIETTCLLEHDLDRHVVVVVIIDNEDPDLFA